MIGLPVLGICFLILIVLYVNTQRQLRAAWRRENEWRELAHHQSDMIDNLLQELGRFHGSRVDR